MSSTALPVPDSDTAAVTSWVRTNLGHLTCDEVMPSSSFRGGQAAADAALAAWDVTGYAARRNEVYPRERRGASALSPYIRHGLLDLPTVWAHVDGGPGRDVKKFRDELLWQEYARHWYARLGTRTSWGVRNRLDGRPLEGSDPFDASPRDPDDTTAPTMACVDEVTDELHTDGWLVNQTRMWMASHWAVRHRADWRDGEDHFFRHLLDGSRAANRLGWQWTTGVGSSKAYGFSRWQVEKRAPGLCRRCPLADRCPIQDWPDDPPLQRIDRPDALGEDPDVEQTAGPTAPVGPAAPDAVWLTAESLGADEPASAAHPDKPLIFVFDEALLDRLRLSGKRLVFLTETLAELAVERPLELHLGDPAEVLAGRSLAVTFAPVPGHRRLARRIQPTVVHPWPWLVRPRAGTIASFSGWRRALKV